MKRIWLCFAAVSALIGGCVSVPKLRTPEVRPPPAYESPKPPADNLSSGALDRWWTLYDDAQLDSLVDLALANSPGAKDALSKLVQANAIRTETLDKLYIPQSTVSGTATETHTDLLSSSSSIPGFSFVVPGNTTSLSGDFGVTWELDLFGRRAAGRRAANADFYTAAFTYEATRTALIASVAQSLFDARGLALQFEDAQKTSDIDKDLLRIVQVKFDHGLSPEGDVDQAVANSESADAQTESYRAQLTAARRTLLVLVGKGFDPLQSLQATPDVGTPPPVPASVPGELLRRRPDVRAAEWQITSAAGTLKVDELAVLPTLQLNPALTLSQSTGPFGATSAAWSIGANLTQPILDRPRLVAVIHAQRAVAEQDVIAYEKAVQTAYGDTENAYMYLESDGRRVKMLQLAEQRAESAYDKARVGYARGFNDLTTTLTTEATWRSIRSQLSSARATLMDRSVQLFKALGGGWTPDQPAAGTPFAAKAVKANAEGVR